MSSMIRNSNLTRGTLGYIIGQDELDKIDHHRFRIKEFELKIQDEPLIKVQNYSHSNPDIPKLIGFQNQISF